MYDDLRRSAEDNPTAGIILCAELVRKQQLIDETLHLRKSAGYVDEILDDDPQIKIRADFSNGGQI